MYAFVQCLYNNYQLITFFLLDCMHFMFNHVFSFYKFNQLSRYMHSIKYIKYYYYNMYTLCIIDECKIYVQISVSTDVQTNKLQIIKTLNGFKKSKLIIHYIERIADIFT